MDEPGELTPPPDFDELITNARANRGEALRFDFKATRDLRDPEERLKLVKTITGFANANAVGYLFIGIADDGSVQGLSPEIAEQYDQTKIKGYLRSYIAPVPQIQVHRPEHQGHTVVVIRVEPFADVPHMVFSGSTQGKTSLIKGSILVRTLGAECSPIDSETEVRRLCDAIAERRATRIVELIQRGLIGTAAITPASTPQPARSEPTNYTALRGQADALWQGNDGRALPYSEVFFESLASLHLSPQQMRSLLPATLIPLRNQEAFPFYDVAGQQIPELKATGWVARLPQRGAGAQAGPAWYLWLLDRRATFLYREWFWEDRTSSNRVDVKHLVERLILLARFVDRVAKRLDLDPAQEFRLGITLHGIRGRVLTVGTEIGLPLALTGTVSPSDADHVQVKADVSLGQLRESVQARVELVATLAEYVAWELNRTDLTRDQFLNYVGDAKNFWREFAFPESELV